MSTYNMYVDGGYDNIRKRNGYGSFAIYKEDELVDIIRFDLPQAKTNNEAEYLSLLMLIDWLDVNYSALRASLINIFSDSNLMVQQVNGQWKIKAGNLAELHAMVKLPDYAKLNWVSRKVIVKILGH